MTTSASSSPPRSIVIFIAGFALLKMLIHLYTNAFQSYGIFRDEMYYLACAEHLDWGYVDQPPLSIWILFLVKSLLGESLFAIRLLPALFSGISVFMIGLITYELGGRKTAIALSCGLIIVNGIHLAYSTFYSMNVLDLMLWSVILYVMLKLINSGQHQYWLYLGVLFGVALLNKIGALFLGAGFFVALLLTPHRLSFKTRWPYLTGIISLIIFSPYIIWNATHDWPHLEFIHNASTYKYSGMNPLRFWSEQFLNNNPVSVPIWLSGIIYVFTNKHNLSYRFLFYVFCGVALILTLNGTSKPEYLAPIFPVLLIGGALQVEQWSLSRKWVAYVGYALLITGTFAIPFAVPILPVERYITYADWIGIKPESAEGKELSALPQFYADMFGWEEKAAAVSKVYQQLTPEEQARCVVFGDNYGRSGAMDYFDNKYPLPPSIGLHNNYWLWGPGDTTRDIYIILSSEVGDKTKIFEHVEDKGVATCQYCMPYENNLHIYVCRGLKISGEELWPKLKTFI